MKRLLCLLAFVALMMPALAAQKKMSSAPRVPPTHANLVYATVGGQPLKLDIYLPADVSKPAPLLIHIHGGGWAGGNKDGLAHYYYKLIDLGFAVASVQYRLTTQAAQWGGAPVIFPAQIQDVKGVVRWLRAHAAEYHLDPNRFGAWGESAGGHLTALLTLSAGSKELEGDTGGNAGISSAVQAGVDYFGPTDMLHINDDITTPPGCVLNHDAPGSFLSNLIGFGQPGQGVCVVKQHLADNTPPYPELRRLLELSSPLSFVKPGVAPLFIGHGTTDLLVPLKQAHRLDEALRKVGARVELSIAPGIGHADLGPKTDRDAVYFLCDILNPEAKGRVDEIKWDAVAPAQKAPKAKAAKVKTAKAKAPKAKAQAAAQ